MNYIVDYNNWKQIYEEVTAQEAIAKQQLISSKMAQLSTIAADIEGWIDIAVDVISGLIDLVPLIGTVISGAVDIVHALTYILRAFLTSTTTKKIEYTLLGAVGLGTAFIPIGGNIANAAARISISEALKLAPKVLTKVPLIKNSAKVIAWASGKNSWRFDFLTVIISHFKSEAITFISEILAKLEIAVKKIIPKLEEWVNNWAVGPIANSLITGIRTIYYTFSDLKLHAPIVSTAINTIS
jgi:hypothetical protein